jgi:NAD(P)-dependent dehydrogenase (short-subunit alcohol dehydrogenase family)
MAARLLINEGHAVVLHGRNEGRSRDALAAAPGAAGVVSGDLSTIAGARTVADEVNKLGRFDAVIHNAGIGYREGRVESAASPAALARELGVHPRTVARWKARGDVADRSTRPHRLATTLTAWPSPPGKKP